MSVYSTQKSKKQKMDRVTRRGPLARAPGALKGGHFRNCQHFCRSWRAGPLEKKTNFRKKVSQCRKTERDPLVFQRPFCRKTSKKLKGGPFQEKNFPKKKSHSAEKN